MKHFKNFLSIYLMLIVLTNCTKQLVSHDQDELFINNSINKVSGADIEKYIDAKYRKTKSTIKIDIVSYNQDSLIYIINHNEGWELISGDKRCKPIIARGMGIFDINNLNPNKLAWLESEAEEIYNVMQTENDSLSNQFWSLLDNPSSHTKAEGDPFEDDKYWELDYIESNCSFDTEETSGHLITTKWGQDTPWNSCVPFVSGKSYRCVAGCVPVAGAQMLYYLHNTIGKPASVYTSGSCNGNENNYLFNFSSSSTFAWEQMALNYFDNNSSRLYQTAILIGWVGQGINTNYGENGSGAELSDLKQLFTDTGISSTKCDYDKTKVWGSLRNNKPVIVCAYAKQTHFLGFSHLSEGHCWIIDGYYRAINSYIYHYKWASRTENAVHRYGDTKEEIVNISTDYLLMNWGWDGSSDNGLYSLPSSWSPNSSYTFKYDKEILYKFD